MCPDRTHLTFERPNGPNPVVPQKTLEENRLVVPFITLEVGPSCRDLVPLNNLTLYLRGKFAATGAPVLLALDGSCLTCAKSQISQVVSWAVVGVDRSATFAARVDGCEQTPAAAERSALLQALLSAHEAQVPVRLLVDNEAIVIRLVRGLKFQNWRGDVPAFWWSISKLVSHGVGVMWIPSHNKKPQWAPHLDWGVVSNAQ